MFSKNFITMLACTETRCIWSINVDRSFSGVGRLKSVRYARKLISELVNMYISIFCNDSVNVVNDVADTKIF